MLLLALSLSVTLGADAPSAKPSPAPDAGSPTATAASPGTPAEFIDDVKVLFDVLACDGATLPANLDAKAVEAFCEKEKPRYQRFQEHWGTTAKAFLGELRPKELPRELVYPFGGGDLMMALTAFPDAQVVTTLSLELAGDPRRLKTLKDAAKLKQSLLAVAEASASTLVSNDSKSVNLSLIQRGELPGQLSMHLIGLLLAGQVPVSVRYFRIEDDGTLHYFSQAEIDALEGAKADKLKAEWKSPDFSPAFANVEVQFVAKGAPADAPRRIHRHVGANLSDAGLAKTPGVLKHLEAKGRVAMMTKAASYLLWRNDFVVMRDYVVGHAAFMFADSTGAPPRYWKKAGCTVETYGTFEKAFLAAPEDFQAELRKEYAAQPWRKLPMRYGYPDGSPEKRSHLIVTRCDGGAADAGVPAKK